MLLIGVAAALWGYNTGNDCKSFTGVVGQFVNRDIQQQCQYTTGALGIGIVFLIVGIILMVGGSTSKEEEQTLK